MILASLTCALLPPPLTYQQQQNLCRSDTSTQEGPSPWPIACRDAIALHNTPRCSLGAPPTLEEFPEVMPGASAVAAAAAGSDTAGNGSSSPFKGTIGGVESLADCKPCSFDFSP